MGKWQMIVGIAGATVSCVAACVPGLQGAAAAGTAACIGLCTAAGNAGAQVADNKEQKAQEKAKETEQKNADLARKADQQSDRAAMGFASANNLVGPSGGAYQSGGSGGLG